MYAAGYDCTSAATLGWIADWIAVDILVFLDEFYPVMCLISSITKVNSPKITKCPGCSDESG